MHFIYFPVCVSILRHKTKCISYYESPSEPFEILSSKLWTSLATILLLSAKVILRPMKAMHRNKGEFQSRTN